MKLSIFMSLLLSNFDYPALIYIDYFSYLSVDERFTPPVYLQGDCSLRISVFYTDIKYDCIICSNGQSN